LKKRLLWSFLFFITKTKPKDMKKFMLEITDAEGGTDAKLLVADMTDIYIKACKINNIH
jgi:protein subunit release factor A